MIQYGVAVLVKDMPFPVPETLEQSANGLRKPVCNSGDAFTERTSKLFFFFA